MKINKKILGLSIAGVAAIATIPTLAVTLTSCGGSIPMGDFYESFNDPYKELEMYAENLDANGIKLYQQEPLTRQEYKLVDGFVSFTEAAKRINNSMGEYVYKLAKTKKIDEFTAKNATVLFVKSKTFSGDANNFETQMNNFYMMQPILYQQIYSEPDYKECPGFGFKFPMPVNNKSNSLFDDWYQIGAKQVSNSSDNTNIPWRLSESWKGTADFVFYLYDSSKLDMNKLPNILKSIYGITKKDENKYLIAKLLKPDAISKHIIPIDIQYLYNGIWDQVGSFAMDYLFAKIFNNIDENGNLKQFQVVGSKQHKEDDEVDTILKYKDTWNPYKIKSQTTALTSQEEANKERVFGVARPDPNWLKEHNVDSKKTKLAVSSYNIIAHTFSLGINPDYISMFKGNTDTNYPYHYFMGYLSPFKDKLTPIEGDKEKYFWLNNENFLNFVKNNANGIYAVGANREKFGGDENTKWPLEDNKSQPQDNLISLVADADGNANPVTPEVRRYARPIFSEQNQSIYTQWVFPNDFKLLINTSTNTTLTVSEWKKEAK